MQLIKEVSPTELEEAKAEQYSEEVEVDFPTDLLKGYGQYAPVKNQSRVKKPAFKYEDGSIYVGEWFGSARDGYGTLKATN